MVSQAELKHVRALQQKKARVEQQRFLVQGRKVVAELVASSTQTESIFASDAAAAFIAPIVARCGMKVPIHVLPAHELKRMGTFETGNELVAVAAIPPQPAFRAPGSGELMLALDGVHDPRNLGSLVRIADWFGVKSILCSPDCMELYNPKVVSSTMGSLFRVTVRYAPLAAELQQCAASGAAIFLASMEGAPVFETALRLPAVLVLGSESHGLSAVLREMAAPTISIPRVGQAESLNVAMAAAALCTEFARQTLNR